MKFLLFLAGIVAFIVAVGAKGGSRSYSSSRYSSYRYSLPSYRYTSTSYRYSVPTYRYRSPSARVRISTSYRYSSYRYNSGIDTSSMSRVPEVTRIRKGGVGSEEKRVLLQAGRVYVDSVVRSSFTRVGEGWIFNGNYDDVAVCFASIPVNGRDADDRPGSFQYFVCPVVQGDEELRYCCGMPNQQNCCNVDQFVRQYGGTLSG